MPLKYTPQGNLIHCTPPLINVLAFLTLLSIHSGILHHTLHKRLSVNQDNTRVKLSFMETISSKHVHHILYISYSFGEGQHLNRLYIISSNAEDFLHVWGKQSSCFQSLKQLVFSIATTVI